MSCNTLLRTGTPTEACNKWTNIHALHMDMPGAQASHQHESYPSGVSFREKEG